MDLEGFVGVRLAQGHSNIYRHHRGAHDAQFARGGCDFEAVPLLQPVEGSSVVHGVAVPT
jgi:hypothetical protein